MVAEPKATPIIQLIKANTPGTKDDNSLLPDLFIKRVEVIWNPIEFGNIKLRHTVLF